MCTGGRRARRSAGGGLVLALSATPWRRSLPACAAAAAGAVPMHCRMPQSPPPPLVCRRCLRLALYGLCLDGPLGHAWYRLLDRAVLPEAPTSTPAVLAKTAADQLVWGPAMCCLFFAFLKTLEGHPELALPTIQVGRGPRGFKKTEEMAGGLGREGAAAAGRVCCDVIVVGGWGGAVPRPQQRQLLGPQPSSKAVPLQQPVH